MAAISRPSWDQVWAQVSRTAAQRSLCARRQVGSVIVTVDNRVASVSFNGAPDAANCQGLPCTEWCERAKTGATDSLYTTCAANHAEANAIMRADWSSIQRGTIYTSSATCINCAKLIGSAGLSRVVHNVSSDDLHRDPAAVTAYLESLGVTVQTFIDIGLEPC